MPDVTRGYCWGRTEGAIGEILYLVGTVAAACVRGLERTGLIATLLHFGRCSASSRDGHSSLLRRWCPGTIAASAGGGAKVVRHRLVELVPGTHLIGAVRQADRLLEQETWAAATSTSPARRGLPLGGLAAVGPGPGVQC
ncbi:glycoside hydrolase family 3 N-terminal domain-containing protein [Micromonospora coxensis]|uniref:glycoside hydrolase family 3 N-terminal domain-containing protein n=1 Tax=Micromonospora coxensis TaxID=356852 RepID=UPI0012FDDA82